MSPAKRERERNEHLRFFSDSQVTLHRITKDFGSYTLYTANRIKNIQKMTNVSDWYYLTTTENWCADLASRGGDLCDFIWSQEWTCGPKFLIDDNYVGVQIGSLPSNLRQIDATEKKKSIPHFHLVAKVKYSASVDFKDVDRSFFEAEPPTSEEAADSENHELNLIHNPEEERKNPSAGPKKFVGLLYRKETFRATVKIIGWIFRFIENCRAAARSNPKRSIAMHFS